MAIHKKFRSIEATVNCNGKPLKELDDPHAANGNSEDNEDGCPTLTKYIECVDDAEFDVNVKIDGRYAWAWRGHSVVIRVFIDGHYVNAALFRRYSWPAHFQCAGKEEYSQTDGHLYMRKLRFSTLTTVDDAAEERIKKDLKTAQGLGTIKVEISRELEVGPSTSLYRHHKTKKMELAEKALKGKALSHGTTFGPRQRVNSRTCITTTKLEDGPMLRIIFLYRSNEALKNELIIPRSPSPTCTIDNLTTEERDRLARERLEQLRDVKIKREGSVVIKREYGETVDLTDENFTTIRPAKRSCLRIDLTDDD